MSEDKAFKSYADTGDLLFCHAVGNKYGWYLNQIAVVIAVEEAAQRYIIYMSANGKKMRIKDSDFLTGNVEVISGTDGSTVKKRMRKTALVTSRMHKVYWDDDDDFNHMGD